jgi:DNA-directed RNA polymerase subunit RPC12/RpoP
VRLALRNCRNKSGFHECPRCMSRSVWKTDPQNTLEETLHFLLRVSPYRCARCDMRFMDAKQRADAAPPTRVSRWMSAFRSAASKAMIFSRRAPFSDDLKLKLTPSPFTPVVPPPPAHREPPLGEAVQHLSTMS